MGQAKARGTFEQRRAEAIERDKKRAEELGGMVGITLIICGFAILCFVLMYGVSILK